MKPAGSSSSTIQDDIPAVHVLEAAQNQDRKEAEDLLAGFDRPGRSPKPVSPERDFVAHFAKKKGAGPDSGPSSRPSSNAPAPVVVAGPRQIDVSTVVVPRKSAGMPAWLGWAGAALLMLTVGGVVAYLATAGDGRPTSSTPTGPSAATTITAGTPAPRTTDNIPPPDPVSATPVIVAEPPVTASAPPSGPTGDVQPRGSAKRDPRGVPSAGASVVRGTTTTTNDDPKKPPPRDDFIRDL